MQTIPKYARLNKNELANLQALENKIGKIVLAYEPDRESPYADLDDTQVEKIRRLEAQLGVVLLAYKPQDRQAGELR
jgi:hypothetical protein